ncbi:hypothetical protein [Mycolicibacterium vanbaalenii]|uniref:hypothetical protein n=1 Tax=Mycolicibacterium vanbaalenii TaxID=110539 RepID=UPI00006E4F32|nr:hypothetical protein [Mycolicibacterium vanbaalenii]MCV7127337.1 hypothetical protein [Mycolicibacterium vanbaalenii PYR-1]
MIALPFGTATAARLDNRVGHAAVSRKYQEYQRAIIDLSVCTEPHLALRVAASRRLELIGVHHRLPTPLSGEAAEETVTAMVACVSCLRRHHGQIATRLSFAGLMPDHNLAPRGLRAAAEKLESLVEDACARFRYPRPALVVQC